jgi:hypothetical protein
VTRSVFLSYSGDRARVGVLATALRRHGMRPWRDADSLPLGARTQAEIEAELAGCRAAMVWLTRQTLESDYVTRVELPTIFAEHDRRGLKIIPIFIDWTPGMDANEAVRLAIGREIGDHNGHHADSSASSDDQSEVIAGNYARALLEELARDDHLDPLVIRCATRTNAASALTDADVNFDWTTEYPSSGGLPDAATEESLRRALARVADQVVAAVGGRGLDVHAKCHLHLGVALGHAFRRPVGLAPRLMVDSDWWPCQVLGPDDVVDPLAVVNSNGPVGATRASVEASITQDVGPGVDLTVAATGTAYRSRTSLRPAAGPGQTVVANSVLANAWAEQIAEAIRTASRQPGVNEVDLYIAAPLQLALLLGWRLNAVGRVHIHHWVGNAGPYQRVWTLSPS